jgi:sugar lactone lactonase YvrE
MTMQAEVIADVRNATGESPVWSSQEQALYWVNIPARQLWRWEAATCEVRHWLAPQMIGCIAADARGGWIAGLESGIFHLQLPLAAQDTHLRVEQQVPFMHSYEGMRANDGRCDRQGRFIVSTMLLAMPATPRAGAFYRYDGTGPAHPIVDDLCVPNGLAFSPDGKTMYQTDTHPTRRTIWAWDYDTDTGTPHSRRVFMDMHTKPGRPDGAAMDVDGGYWVCGNDAGLVHRFTPDGRLDRSLPVPCKKPSMCTFGGPNLDTLFVTSIRPGNIDLSDQPLAGGVFALRPGTCGVPEPQYLATSTLHK